jgi:hypothetical protein
MGRSTEERVAELLDRIAIQELSARYNATVDQGDGDGHAALWTEDGAFEIVGGPPPIVGTDALRAVPARTKGRTVHATTDHVIQIDGDRATQTCTLLMYRRRPDHSVNDLVTTGRYEDELVRGAAGWRFRRRRALLDQSRERSQQLMQA